MAPPSARDPSKLPVRANTGGYLRAPLQVSTAFAIAAERHVGELGRSVSAASKKWKQRNEELDEDASDQLPSRQWTRAGVGASALSIKERKAQQEAAERVYGDQLTHSGDERETLQVEQQHMFGVDLREQETMRVLLPRKIRMERKEKQKGPHHSSAAGARNQEDLHEEGMMRPSQKVMEKKEEDNEREPNRGTERHPHTTYRGQNQHDDVSRTSSGDPSPKLNSLKYSSSASSLGNSESSSKYRSQTEPPAQKRRREEEQDAKLPSAAPPQAGASTPPAPLNRMQQIRRMQEAALFGLNKKKKK